MRFSFFDWLRISGCRTALISSQISWYWRYCAVKIPTLPAISCPVVGTANFRVAKLVAMFTSITVLPQRRPQHTAWKRSSIAAVHAAICPS
ncbi:hypothetical protein RCM15_17260 [Escherichia coli]|nr:hypothetical protein [Escherichia coli]